MWLIDIYLVLYLTVFSFSFNSSSQKYVQDVFREQLSETVYKYLREEGGHIYVCGDVTMAGDVLKTVQQIFKLHGNMSLEDAGFYISKLRVRSHFFPNFILLLVVLFSKLFKTKKL